jgi:hypothetical protein
MSNETISNLFSLKLKLILYQLLATLKIKTPIVFLNWLVLPWGQLKMEEIRFKNAIKDPRCTITQDKPFIGGVQLKISKNYISLI